MHRRSIAIGAILLIWTAAPGLPAERQSLLAGGTGVECDRALADAQDIQAMVPPGRIVIVGEVPISTYEVKQRILWHVALARDEDAAWKSRTKFRIMQAMRREAMDDLAAKRADVVLSPAEIDAQVDDFLSAQGLTRHELQMAMDRAGVQLNTLRNVVAAQLLRARLNRTPVERLPVAAANCLKVS